MLDTGTRLSEELGTAWHLPSYQMVRAVERFTAGEWDDAVVEVEASLDLAGETGETYSLILAGSVLSLICLHRNDLARAAQVSEAANRQLVQTGARYRSQWSLLARALIMEAEGKPDDALAGLTECWDLCTRLDLALEYRVLGPDLVRLALAAGDTGLARDVSSCVTDLAAGNEVSSLTGAALRCRGLVEDDAEILQAAVDAYAGSPRRPELALASEDAGAAFARQGRLERARPLLDQAIVIYEGLDASRDLARTEAVLRGAGIRRGRRGKRSPRSTAGRASPRPSRPSRALSPKGCPIRRSATGCTSRAAPCRRISPTYSPSSTSRRALNSPPWSPAERTERNRPVGGCLADAVAAPWRTSRGPEFTRSRHVSPVRHDQTRHDATGRPACRRRPGVGPCRSAPASVTAHPLRADAFERATQRTQTMSTEHAMLPVPATAVDVHRILLDPRALPDWNPAFNAVVGPPTPQPGVSYAIRVRPGLTGTLEYTTITPHLVEITWQVPGFRETGSWTVEQQGASTVVSHEFRHSGPLASALRRNYRGVAALRLQRLAQRLETEVR